MRMSASGLLSTSSISMDGVTYSNWTHLGSVTNFLFNGYCVVTGQIGVLRFTAQHPVDDTPLTIANRSGLAYIGL